LNIQDNNKYCRFIQVKSLTHKSINLSDNVRIMQHKTSRPHLLMVALRIFRLLISIYNVVEENKCKRHVFFKSWNNCKGFMYLILSTHNIQFKSIRWVSLTRAFYSNPNQTNNKKRKETCCVEDICRHREWQSQPLALALFGFRTPPASRVTLSTTNQNELYYMIPTLKTIPTSSTFLWALSLKVYYVSAAGGAILEVALAWGGEGEAHEDGGHEEGVHVHQAATA